MSVLTTPESYTPYLDEDFVHSDAGGQMYRFTLKAVERRIDTDEQLCFSLLFKASDGHLPQASYRLSHPKLGEIDLFLVPIQRKRDSFSYEAVFNLLKDEAQ